jgi:subtilisin family serine protease
LRKLTNPGYNKIMKHKLWLCVVVFSALFLTAATLPARQPQEAPWPVYIVSLRQQTDLKTLSKARPDSEKVLRSLQDTARLSQGSLLAWLKQRQRSNLVGQIKPFWIFNGFSVQLDPAILSDLARQPGILEIHPEFTLNSAPTASGQVEPFPTWNINLVNAPALWAQGFHGQNVVVANLDTGVDLNHPDLNWRWRGGSNSWFDPHGQHASPADLNGHGTQTMGIILGGDQSNYAIGMAPGARWIAVKLFNDQGSTTETAIHQAYQWVLDPDGNPATHDSPDVVNNSWGVNLSGCYTNPTIQADLSALRAAGILPVFSAGNNGPNENTDTSPANYDEAFSVGAINPDSIVYTQSSRGPNTCRPAAVFPLLTAPGVGIFSAERGGGYTQNTGTSFAAPHVSGALALLISAFPGLTPDQQRAALLDGAVDLSPAGPDNQSGYGRLDVNRSFEYLVTLLGHRPTPQPEAPTPTPTFTPVPSLTPTPSPTPTLPPHNQWLPLLAPKQP